MTNKVRMVKPLKSNLEYQLFKIKYKNQALSNLVKLISLLVSYNDDITSIVKDILVILNNRITVSDHLQVIIVDELYIEETPNIIKIKETLNEYLTGPIKDPIVIKTLLCEKIEYINWLRLVISMKYADLLFEASIQQNE
jgi:hypothetical protein